MEIKDIIAQVRAKLPAEAPAEITTLLSDIVRRGDELLSDRSSANNESKTRKEKIRELEATIETNKTEARTAKEAADVWAKEKEELGTYKEKWEASRTKADEANKAKWETIKAKFDVKETEPEFDAIAKIKKYYVLTDELTPVQIEANIKQAEQHTELGLFTIDKAEPPGTPKGKDVDSGKLTEVKLWD